MKTFKAKLVRLAYTNAELRPHLLPLLKQATKIPEDDAELQEIRDVLAALRRKAQSRPWEFFAIIGNPEREGIGAEVSRSRGSGIISKHIQLHRAWSKAQGYQDIDWS